MKKHIIIFCLLCLSGCTSFNGTKLEGLLGSDEDLISLSYTIAEDLNKNAMPRLMPRNPEQPLLITTFVDNNDLRRTSQFGRTLQEHISSRFVQLGYTVREVKLRGDLMIQEKSGETILSRDPKHINPKLSAQAIVVGTYSFSNRTMYISTRLISPENSAIISSADYKLVMDDNILAMFGLNATGDNPYTISSPKESLINKIFY